MKAITLILPVYNVAQYILKCLHSIHAQSFRDFNLVLVDDCGHDNSIPLSLSFLAETSIDYQVVHNPKNLGIAETRNAGLAAATGEFILFIDPDDWIEPDMLKILYLAATGNNADIATCGGREIWEKDGNTSQITIPAKGVYAPAAYLELLFNWETTAYFWLRLFRRNLFDGIRFHKDVIFEDFLLFPQLVEKANKVVQTDDILYNYIRRNESITLSRPVNVPGFMKKMEELEQHFQGKTAIRSLVKYNYTLLYFFIFNLFRYSDTFSKAKTDIAIISKYMKVAKLLQIRSATRPVIWYFLLLVKVNAAAGYFLFKKWHRRERK